MITKPKGTYDLFGKDAENYKYLLTRFEDVCQVNNYQYMKTPVFEASNLFHRGVGETTDIVTKETYDFKDRGDRDITLRPEGTAGVVRALIENKLYANTNNYLKYYYYGPMFRYERPQSGRFREFNQFGIEVFGKKNYLVDAEVINLGVMYFESLGIKNIRIKINNLGTKEERQKYRDELVKYMSNYKDSLCEDCLNRLETNPLRILDCKKDSSKEFFKNVPKISDYLSKESKDYFNKLLEMLECLNIEYEVDENLVRGLDYYDYAVFEFITDDESLSNASTICGGGRYNSLVKTLDGPDMSGVGFAIGFERLNEIVKNIDKEAAINDLEVYVAAPEEMMDDAFIIGEMLRNSGFVVEIDYRNTKLANKLATASKMNAKYAVMILEEEFKEYKCKLKDLETKEETVVPINDLIDELYYKF